jgi:hypothetical protein
VEGQRFLKMFATLCMKRELAPRGGFEPPTFRLTAEQPLHQNLPELALIEGNQQVAMKPDESLSIIWLDAFRT